MIPSMMLQADYDNWKLHGGCACYAWGIFKALIDLIARIWCSSWTCLMMGDNHNVRVW